MTESELYNRVMTELDRIVADIQGGLGSVPMDTGNLRRSIKVRVLSPTKFQLYIDEQQAPYAEDINEHVAFWNRLYHQVSYRLANVLGQVGQKE